MRGLQKTIYIILFCICVCSTKNTQAQETDYKAYSLFVYNFMKYIEWPSESQNKQVFVIAVFGDSPIFKELEILAASKKYKGKPIQVKKIITVDDKTECDLLYVASSKSANLKTILPLIKNKTMLLVAERDGMAKKGADISFTTLDDDVLKFEINKKAIESHHLKISSTLIALGIVVN